MVEIARYGRAVYIRELRALEGWEEKADDLRMETRIENGEEIEFKRTELHDDDIVWLQDSYCVTDDIYADRNIIFDQVTEEWKTACQEQLGFEVPDYEPYMLGDEEPSEDEAADSDDSVQAAS